MGTMVSIIMPAYNAAQFLPRTLDSVLSQTWLDWELLLIDDGSTDTTKELMQKYIMLDVRIKYLYQPNGRQGKARNHGLKKASGDYVAFLDADDIWLPDKLAKQVVILGESGADLVFCNSYVFQEDAQLSSPFLLKLPKLISNSGTKKHSGLEAIKVFLASNQIPILTVVAKKEALLKSGGFGEDPSFQNAEDYHLWLKMLLEGFIFVETDDILAVYRKRSDSVSDTDGLNLSQVVEAKFDLIEKFVSYRSLIISSIPATIVSSLYEVNKWDNSRFYHKIERYLDIVQKGNLKIIFKFFRLANARRLALRSSYYIFNRIKFK